MNRATFFYKAAIVWEARKPDAANKFKLQDAPFLIRTRKRPKGYTKFERVDDWTYPEQRVSGWDVDVRRHPEREVRDRRWMNIFLRAR